jgi:ubiquinone biosynthesis protein COQ9
MDVRFEMIEGAKDGKKHKKSQRYRWEILRIKQKEKILHALQKRLVTARAVGQFLRPCEAKCLGNTP